MEEGEEGEKDNDPLDAFMVGVQEEVISINKADQKKAGAQLAGGERADLAPSLYFAATLFRCPFRCIILYRNPLQAEKVRRFYQFLSSPIPAHWKVL